jgi:hypothetical protein
MYDFSLAFVENANYHNTGPPICLACFLGCLDFILEKFDNDGVSKRKKKKKKMRNGYTAMPTE